MGLFSSVGKLVNNVLGGTSSAKQAQNYALQQMAINNKYQKEFAQNAHQWEVADLEKAGLNPILSAGGTGASASGGGTASGPTSANGNIADLGTLASGITSSVKNIASALRDQSETTKNIEGMEYIKPQAKAQLENTLSATSLNNQNKLLSAQKVNESKAQEKYTNERARGFSESESHSESKSTGTEFGGNIGNKKFGSAGAKAGHNSAKTISHSKSRTY